ncbi:MAG: hypothetical protein ACSLEZ_14115 [Thiobacillus sp.]
MRLFVLWLGCSAMVKEQELAATARHLDQTRSLLQAGALPSQYKRQATR